MMLKIQRKLMKNKWDRLGLMLLAALFVFQSYPPLCGACLTGECSSADGAYTSSSKMACHDAEPAKSCYSEKSDTESQSSESDEDSCPSCNCSITGAVDVPERIALTSTGSLPLFFVCEVLEIMDPAMNLREYSFLDSPAPGFRFHPIFILNSSFLI